MYLTIKKDTAEELILTVSRVSRLMIAFIIIFVYYFFLAKFDFIQSFKHKNFLDLFFYIIISIPLIIPVYYLTLFRSITFDKISQMVFIQSKIFFIINKLIRIPFSEIKEIEIKRVRSSTTYSWKLSLIKISGKKLLIDSGSQETMQMWAEKISKITQTPIININLNKK